jgi:hypothetical protein
MTVKELIVELQKHNPDIDVAFKWDGGYATPEDPEIIKVFNKKVLVFDVSDYGSWERDKYDPNEVNL